MELFIGDKIEIFKEYEISERDIISTYTSPERFELLANNVRLFLKSFNNNDDRRVLLLVGTQQHKGENLLAFSYWIPSGYKKLDVNLIDILELFSNQFGLKIKIGDIEGYFIKNAESVITGNLEHPDQILEILAPDKILFDSYLFYSENLIGSVNRVSIYYAFAINRGKYIFWVNSFPNVKMEVKAGWYDYVKNNLVDYLQPDRKTKIRIQKQKFTEKLEYYPTNEMSTIEVPSMYENQLRYIFSQINNLKNKEKILFDLSFDTPTCLFCQSNDISKEHIFPIWLRSFLKETTFGGTIFSRFGNESLNSMLSSATTYGKKESSHGYTAKIVCKTCNNTWMSQLESDAKSILIRNNKLIDIILNSISCTDSEKLSVWLIVKALLLANRTFLNMHRIEKKVFENLRKQIIAPGFLVETTSSSKTKFDCSVGKGILDDRWIKLKNISLERGKEMTTDFFRCSIQLNHLLFRISYIKPNIPLTRETVFKKTQTLFPFGEITKHRKIGNDNEIWRQAVNKNKELYLFNLGLILVENDKQKI